MMEMVFFFIELKKKKRNNHRQIRYTVESRAHDAQQG